MDVLDRADRLEFERLLEWLRLTFLLSPLLVLAAFGAGALAYAGLIVAAVASSYCFVRVLLRHSPQTLLRFQIGLRILDCLIVWFVLTLYHGFLGNAYYDSVYLLFVAAAAATHGRRGAVIVAGVAGVLTLLARGLLIIGGSLSFETRHITDPLFYTLFFGAVGLAVAFLMERSGETVARREREWRAQLAARNAGLERLVRDLAGANSDLERLAAENAAQYAQARAALEARDTYLAAASHDLKNPLTAISVYAQMLSRESAGAGEIDPQRVLQRLQRIESAARRVQCLADELSDVARLDLGGELPLRTSRTDLMVLVRQVLDEFQQRFPQQTFHLDTEEGTLEGVWDAPRIERVLSNLLTNATKYSPGSGRITVSVRRRGTTNLEPRAEICVADTGIGIPEADQPRIFEPYHRGSNVTGQMVGSGLGLAGVKAIVEQHGGTVHLASREGAGTSVTFTLPLTPAQDAQPAYA